MNRRKPTDLAASVRQRLLDISRRAKTDANLIWTRYAVERLLYRLDETVTIARIPAFTASGRLSHEAATWAKPGGISGAFSAFSAAR